MYNRQVSIAVGVEVGGVYTVWAISGLFVGAFAKSIARGGEGGEAGDPLRTMASSAW